MSTPQYPMLEVHLNTIRRNTEALVRLLAEHSISLTGVVKGFHALPRVVSEFVQAGCAHIASSRLDQLTRLRHRGIQAPLMLLRIPMLSELDQLIVDADISLNSEVVTIEALSDTCARHGERHGVVLMLDVGDLREGFFDPEELISLAVRIERTMPELELKGIGTNVGCYGAVVPTVDNLGLLADTAARVEQRIGRRLEIVSGGASSSLPLLLDGQMPKGITNLRVGEAILNNRDLPELWHRYVPGLSADTFVLKAQVVELKEKPSVPRGETFIDAFGHSPHFVDRGFRHRALLAVGRQDIGDPDKLVPLVEGLEVVGASSDHLIVDIDHCVQPVKVGDVLPFGMYYAPLLYLSGSTEVHKVYRRC